LGGILRPRREDVKGDLHLPQVDETQTPRLMDAAGVFFLYDTLQGKLLNQNKEKPMLYTILVVLLILFLLGYLR
jgi:hypothetical protein